MYETFRVPLMGALVAALVVCGVAAKYRRLPSNCLEATMLAGKNAKSGVYQIRLPMHDWNRRRFFAYCLCEPNCDNPWLVVQRRVNDSIDFYRGWNDYKYGFGNMHTNFWFGLEKLHALTTMQHNELQIVMRDFNDTVKYANYEGFAVGNEQQLYELNMLGPYSGDAGDALLEYHDGQKFSTHDKDNDKSSKNCASATHAAWWYNSCFNSNPNSEYFNTQKHKTRWGISWYPFTGFYDSLKYIHIAIRPKANDDAVLE